MIELLVAISIIAVLLGLSAAATFKLIGAQLSSNTKTTLVKLQSQLDKQWAAVTHRAKDEDIPDSLRNNPHFATMIGTDANAEARARVLYVKLKQRQMFPMTFDEALNPYPLPPLLPYGTYLKSLGVSASSPQTQPYESAVCLLMALERSPSGGGVKMEDLGVGTAVAAFTLPSGAQVNGLIDAWKSPLVFCRWPTGSPQLNPGGAAAGANDSADPQGLLNAPTWVGNNGYSVAARTFMLHGHALPPRPPGSRLSSYKLAPIIMSAGADAIPDVDPMTLAETGPGAQDNLYSTNPQLIRNP